MIPSRLNFDRVWITFSVETSRKTLRSPCRDSVNVNLMACIKNRRGEECQDVGDPSVDLFVRQVMKFMMEV